MYAYTHTHMQTETGTECKRSKLERMRETETEREGERKRERKGAWGLHALSKQASERARTGVQRNLAFVSDEECIGLKAAFTLESTCRPILQLVHSQCCLSTGQGSCRKIQ